MMKKKILVIDDDPAILEVVELILSGKNYDVQTSENGKVIKSLEIMPDLIVLDVLLSGEDGRDIIKKIRKNKTMNKIPVVMFSAHPNAGKSLIQLGASDFIEKPFDIEDFLKIIAKNIN